MRWNGTEPWSFMNCQKRNYLCSLIMGRGYICDIAKTISNVWYGWKKPPKKLDILRPACKNRWINSFSSNFSSVRNWEVCGIELVWRVKKLLFYQTDDTTLTQAFLLILSSWTENTSLLSSCRTSCSILTFASSACFKKPPPRSAYLEYSDGFYIPVSQYWHHLGWICCLMLTNGPVAQTVKQLAG